MIVLAFFVFFGFLFAGQGGKKGYFVSAFSLFHLFFFFAGI